MPSDESHVLSTCRVHGPHRTDGTKDPADLYLTTEAENTVITNATSTHCIIDLRQFLALLSINKPKSLSVIKRAGVASNSLTIANVSPSIAHIEIAHGPGQYPIHD